MEYVGVWVKLGKRRVDGSQRERQVIRRGEGEGQGRGWRERMENTVGCGEEG